MFKIFFSFIVQLSFIVELIQGVGWEIALIDLLKTFSTLLLFPSWILSPVYC